MEELVDEQEQKPWWRTDRGIVTIAIGLAATAFIGALVGNSLGSDDDPPEPVSLTRQVTYEVEGDGASFEMTAETPTGTTQATPDLPLRLESGGLLTYEFFPGDFVYLSAQSKDGRTITCRITVDGLVISENTSTGEYAIATCKGSA